MLSFVIIKSKLKYLESNLRQKSGKVWKREELSREFVGDDAGDLLLEDEGRGDGVGGGQRTNENICKKK
jgi:hypothetical protein